MLKTLVLLANNLDKSGFTREANVIDNLIIKVSMPLIHDDPFKTKLVYRIENSNGDGPYYEDQIYEERSEDEQPTPYHPDYAGQDFTDKELDFLFEKREPLLFGFDSPYDAVLWFGEDTLSDLYNKGFKVCEMHAKKVYLSHTKRQIMFVNDETQPKRELSLDEVLRSNRDQADKGFLKPKTYDTIVIKKLDALKIKFDKLMKALETEQNDDIDQELFETVNVALNLTNNLSNPPKWVGEAVKMLGILSPLPR